ncbi:ferritin-like domain-containing protein [Sulfurospirillum sp. 1612]|uniref:ferritin-like domain-containing protein n=1 Tax=Sulfurospirillum sp. 1612 TaxID=3094835 RepID=UPI002F93216E
MNAYEYAMEMEKEGESFYRELANKSTDIGIKNIFLNLANEEVKHYELFKRLAQEEGDASVPKMNVMKDAKAIFAEMKASGRDLDFGHDQVVLYQKALESEKKAYDLYVKKADEVTDAKHKEIFLRIAAEEKKHLELLENLVDFVDSPMNWLESAEFYNMGEAR